MTITQDDMQIMRMEILSLESSLLDARNEIDRLRAENKKMWVGMNTAKVYAQTLKNELEAMTWRALAAEGSNESFMRKKFNNLGE